MIVHFVGDVSRFFAHPVGEASFEALRLIRPQFKAALRSATFKMFSNDSQSDVRFEVRESSADPAVLVVGRRFVEPSTQEPLAFVRFQDVETETSAVTVFAADNESNSVILELEHELERRAEEMTRRFEGADVPRPPHWGGYRVSLDRIEFWQGDKYRLHDRVEYRMRADGTYEVRRLCP
jgi:hypothetical protein